jgi:hypothetical protein
VGTVSEREVIKLGIGMAEASQQLSQVGASVFEDEGDPPGDPASTQGRPPKFPCIRCRKNVGRNSVRCKTCQLWIHAECGNISKELLNILANPTKYGAGCVSWNCDSCQASAARLDERMNLLEGRFMEVENRVVRSEGIVQDATRRVDNVETRQANLEKNMEQEREKIRGELAEEMREREMRRRNVVMHRVGEAGPEVKSVEERRAWDLKSCDNIFRALELDMSSGTAVKFVRRVGERGDGPRPMIVGLKKEWQKEEVLERAKQLRDTHFPEVVIVPDLTKEQRKEEAAMNGEADKRNKERTEEDRAKNLEWMVVGARGERRLVKGVARARPAAAGGPPRGQPVAAARGRGQPPAAARGRGAATLLPSMPRQEPWAAAGGRGAGPGARGRPRLTSKRTRSDRQEPDENMEDEEEMEDERQAPPQPTGRT